MSKKSLNVSPRPFDEKTSHMRTLNGFSLSSGKFCISEKESLKFN